MTKFSVSQLKEEIKLRGLAVNRNKKKLVGKIQEAIKSGVPLVENMKKEKAANLAGESFSRGAYWEIFHVQVISKRKRGKRDFGVQLSLKEKH